MLIRAGKRGLRSLPDISAQFLFPPIRTQGNVTDKEASGELGVPGKVATHRIVSAQRAMSNGTFDHAGHMIGIPFGASRDARNPGLQNANMNTFAPKRLPAAFQGHGGSYRDLESRWSERLKEGYKIRVRVGDKYRKGENRPFTRWVQGSKPNREQLRGRCTNWNSGISVRRSSGRRTRAYRALQEIPGTAGDQVGTAICMAP